MQCLEISEKLWRLSYPLQSDNTLYQPFVCSEQRFLCFSFFAGKCEDKASTVAV